jgi:hypothetical protein
MKISSAIVQTKVVVLNYTYDMRKLGTAALTLAVVLGVFLAPLPAIEQSYATATLRSVQKKYHDQVLYYLYNTPIMREDPYFEVSVQLRDIVVVGEYTPRYEGEPLPDNWKVGEPVEVRLEKHYIYLQRPNGSDVKFLISDQYTPKPASNRP